MRDVCDNCYFSLVTSRLVMSVVINDHLCSFENAGSAAIIKTVFPGKCLRFGFQLSISVVLRSFYVYIHLG